MLGDHTRAGSLSLSVSLRSSSETRTLFQVITSERKAMGREVRGSSAAARAPTTKAAPAATSAPVRKSRRYGALTAATPLNRGLSFDHVAAASEQGYCSLPSSREGPISAEGGGRGCARRLLRRVAVGAVVITLFAAAVSTLYGGRASSESGVGGVSYPKMAAEVSAELCVLGFLLHM